MLANSPIINDASGRVGDTVWARNRYGLYIRALGNPNPNPPTDEQLACRAAMALAVSQWRSELTPEQRSDWTRVARDNPEPSRLGVVRPIDGLAAFTRANYGRYQWHFWNGDEMPYIWVAPEQLIRPWADTVPLTVTLVEGEDEATLDHDASAPWNTSDYAGLAIYCSPSLDPTVHFFKSPMTMTRFIVASDSSSDPFYLGRTAEAGKHYKIRFVPYYADGSVSHPITLDVATP